ncbi:hypothetical protein F5Y19DRAFT_474675 [Xylariaceae sp. FL1651]|nr:hypothetical protein F5Y19DRAFT_474675 [Xylariaceae sp. FL1651]
MSLGHAVESIAGLVLREPSHTNNAQLAIPGAEPELYCSIQGIGQGGIVSLSQLILTTRVPADERERWFKFLMIPWALGIALSPLISGILAQTGGWRWIFSPTIPLCLLPLPIIFFSFDPDRGQSAEKHKLTDIDWLGCAVIVVSAILLLVPLS